MDVKSYKAVQKKMQAQSVKFASIDVGSNAVRLLLARVFREGDRRYYRKESLVRMPIRLGDEVFLGHPISHHKIYQLVKTMGAFKLLIEAYEPLDYIACATSAFRDAQNGQAVVEQIEKESGIALRIIDGREEAEAIFLNTLESDSENHVPFLYIDVGGGSTEFTFFKSINHRRSASFNIGTIRLLEDLVADSDWDRMKNWIKENTRTISGIRAIGSGGNINKIFRLSAVKEGKPISYKKLKNIYKNLKKYSFEERIKVMRLRPDRADVIIPAAQIYLNAMKWAHIAEIYVPEVGLSDGLIHLLYQKHLQRP